MTRFRPAIFASLFGLPLLVGIIVLALADGGAPVARATIGAQDCSYDFAGHNGAVEFDPPYGAEAGESLTVKLTLNEGTPADFPREVEVLWDTALPGYEGFVAGETYMEADSSIVEFSFAVPHNGFSGPHDVAVCWDVGDDIWAYQSFQYYVDPTLECSSPSADSGANLYVEDPIAAGSGGFADLTNIPVNPYSDQELEIILDRDSAPPGQLLAEDGITAGNSEHTQFFHLPDDTPQGTHTITACWFWGDGWYAETVSIQVTRPEYNSQCGAYGDGPTEYDNAVVMFTPPNPGADEDFIAHISNVIPDLIDDQYAEMLWNWNGEPDDSFLTNGIGHIPQDSSSGAISGWTAPDPVEGDVLTICWFHNDEPGCVECEPVGTWYYKDIVWPFGEPPATSPAVTSPATSPAATVTIPPQRTPFVPTPTPTETIPVTEPATEPVTEPPVTLPPTPTPTATAPPPTPTPTPVVTAPQTPVVTTPAPTFPTVTIAPPETFTPVPTTPPATPTTPAVTNSPAPVTASPSPTPSPTAVSASQGPIFTQNQQQGGPIGSTATPTPTPTVRATVAAASSTPQRSPTPTALGESDDPDTDDPGDPADLPFDPDDGARPEWVQSVPRIGDINTSASVIMTNIALAGFSLMLLLVSAEILNQTVEENEKDIKATARKWFGPALAVGEGIGAGWHSLFGNRTGLATLLAAPFILLFTGLLYVIEEPGFGMNEQTLVLLAGILITMAFLTYVYDGTQVVLARQLGANSVVRLFPIGIVIAMICVLFTRLDGFQPGVIYGFIAAATLIGGSQLSREDDGRVVFFPAMLVLSICILAWLLVSPFRDMATDHPDSAWAALPEAVAVGIFVGAVQGIFFQLIPMKFLDGHKVWKWSKLAWVGLAGVTGFLFWHVMLNTHRSDFGAVQETVPATAIIAMALCFLLTLSVYVFFRFRQAAIGGGGELA